MTKNLILVGASQMAVDYYHVLKELDCNVSVVGRGMASAKDFENKTGAEISTGGLLNYIKSQNSLPETAVVATGIEQLHDNALLLIKNGVKKILLEKPGAVTLEELFSINEHALQNNCDVFIGYNRRFYSSVLKGQKLIEESGGVSSFTFDFTEWSHKIEPLEKKPGIKENWFIGNSTHVIDMAFFLGGKPTSMKSFSSEPLNWHKASIFTGTGITKDKHPFVYHANWKAAGRWAVEILTPKCRLIYKPLEELYLQDTGSIVVNKVELEDALDKKFKPGLYLQTKAFLEGNHLNLKPLSEQITDMDWYLQMLNGN